MPEPSILDERLAEIDRRLRTIQTDLAPAAVAVPESVALADEPEPFVLADEQEPFVLEDEPEEVALGDQPAQPLTPPIPLRPAPPLAPGPDEFERIDALVGQLRDLTAAHARLLELHRDLLGQYASVLDRPAAVGTTAALTAGPFADGDAVRVFTDGVAGLPGVDRVDVREYLDGGRVTLEARLDPRR